MLLSEVAPDLVVGTDLSIAGIATHSADVRPGMLFAALNGVEADGARYAAAAVEKGAVAILAGNDAELPSGVPVLRDARPRHRLALMAARWHGKQPQTVVAVTGTNGKTSVACFVRQLWQALGTPAASVGTLGVLGDGVNEPLRHTTPEPVTLHRVLADLANRGLQHAVVEASSHGLDQCRLDAARISAAGFTNLSRDHFDYHADYETYFAAKMRLFSEVMAPGGVAVLNADSREHPRVAKLCRERGHAILSYGRHGRAFRVAAHRGNPGGQYVALEFDGEPGSARLPLVGEFQTWNALCALGLVVGAGGDRSAAVAALQTLKGAPGRVQEVAESNGGRVFVDYAHSPESLENCLRALRSQARSRLTVVFGCGGDRDRGKRPEMGRVACALADRVVVTDDNPRREDAARIRAEVLAGCDHAVEVPERGEAIRVAVSGLDEGDVLLIAGKGHETGQVIKDAVLPFDDARAAREAAQEFSRVRT